MRFSGGGAAASGALILIAEMSNACSTVYSAWSNVHLFEQERLANGGHFGIPLIDYPPVRRNDLCIQLRSFVIDYSCLEREPVHLVIRKDLLKKTFLKER